MARSLATAALASWIADGDVETWDDTPVARGSIEAGQERSSSSFRKKGRHGARPARDWSRAARRRCGEAASSFFCLDDGARGRGRSTTGALPGLWRRCRGATRPGRRPSRAERVRPPTTDVDRRPEVVPRASQSGGPRHHRRATSEEVPSSSSGERNPGDSDPRRASPDSRRKRVPFAYRNPASSGTSEVGAMLRTFPGPTR
mmetsp:Transcript_7683/g.25239  ORF Transcript_7683/g.25239 Transcript_7683/m.25239 type:complete len:202 (-) Transcript_7683:192-797(-)